MYREKITEMIMESNKAHNTNEVRTYRAIKEQFDLFVYAKNQTKPLDDAAEIKILNKMIKERQEDVDVFIRNGRKELVPDTSVEIDILKTLVPQAATQDEIMIVVDEYIAQNGPISKKEMGKCIQYVKSKLSNADGKLTSEVVKSVLIG